MLANEGAWRSEADTRAALQRIWEVMRGCVARGITQEGVLPGGLNVRRRAAALHRKLSERAAGRNLISDTMAALDWVNLYALAVNEENAGGGRVVTAPTNGAAGIIPAVLHYYMNFMPGSSARLVTSPARRATEHRARSARAQHRADVAARIWRQINVAKPLPSSTRSRFLRLPCTYRGVRFQSTALTI